MDVHRRSSIQPPAPTQISALRRPSQTRSFRGRHPNPHPADPERSLMRHAVRGRSFYRFEHYTPIAGEALPMMPASLWSGAAATAHLPAVQRGVRGRSGIGWIAWIAWRLASDSVRRRGHGARSAWATGLLPDPMSVTFGNPKTVNGRPTEYRHGPRGRNGGNGGAESLLRGPWAIGNSPGSGDC